MNHFFAIKLSEEAQQTVQHLAEEWRSLVMRSSWYDPEDYHITLKFLGNVDEAQQPRLIEAAQRVAAAAQQVAIHSAPAGGFPSMRDPSVLWAGVSANLDLEALAAHLDHAMAGVGFRSDRRHYQPHITVARCRLKTTRGAVVQGEQGPADWPLAPERPFVNFTADRFVLMQTRSGVGGANPVGLRYNVVHTFPLGDPHSSNVF